MTDLVPGLY